MNLPLSLAFSPCPNDTFIFDAMVHHKVDTEGLEFTVEMADVENLNKKAFSEVPDIVKLSYHAFAFLTDKYQLLNAGSALGNNCGPLLIARSPMESLAGKKVAIPGKYTTANFLLGLAYPEITDKVEMVFSEIEDAVLSGKVDAGLIIHENRFTFHLKGLHKIIDLGEFWESTTGYPIPLGGIAVRKSLPEALKQKIGRVLRKSVEFAFANPESSKKFIRENAQEMDEQVIESHINLYVNDFSVNLGMDGRNAIEMLYKIAKEKNIIPEISENIFIN
ncbi:MAG: 1,4-dihydroxy-6-naphthoate synthase [Bacteroidetes bacterium]|nr:1,4-dihydroxy-6-naphthoate synthase [Bacteroidota bacterium]